MFRNQLLHEAKLTGQPLTDYLADYKIVGSWQIVHF
mgnify:CR=1 FL=1